MRESGWPFAAIFLFCLATPVQAGPPTMTPETLVQALMAGKDGPEENILALMTVESVQGLHETEPAGRALERAQSDYRTALDERFGPSPALATPMALHASSAKDVQAALRPVQSMQFAGVLQREPGLAAVRIRVVERTAQGQTRTIQSRLNIKREGRNWKIMLPDASEPHELNRRIQAMQQIAAKIRSGAYANRQAAMVAMANAVAPGTPQ